MKQADDFLLESQALDALIGPLTEAELTQVTGFKSWTSRRFFGISIFGIEWRI
jgi:hypothetical protein